MAIRHSPFGEERQCEPRQPLERKAMFSYWSSASHRVLGFAFLGIIAACGSADSHSAAGARAPIDEDNPASSSALREGLDHVGGILQPGQALYANDLSQSAIGLTAGGKQILFGFFPAGTCNLALYETSDGTPKGQQGEPMTVLSGVDLANRYKAIRAAEALNNEIAVVSRLIPGGSSVASGTLTAPVKQSTVGKWATDGAIKNGVTPVPDPSDVTRAFSQGKCVLVMQKTDGNLTLYAESDGNGGGTTPLWSATGDAPVPAVTVPAPSQNCDDYTLWQLADKGQASPYKCGYWCVKGDAKNLIESDISGYVAPAEAPGFTLSTGDVSLTSGSHKRIFEARPDTWTETTDPIKTEGFRCNQGQSSATVVNAIDSIGTWARKGSPGSVLKILSNRQVYVTAPDGTVSWSLMTPSKFDDVP